MENLDKSDGGDNLNLIFKVLKRGDKLEKALASGDEKQLSDMGLRYDLTLPLSRYYAAHRNELPAPFKVIQTDRVYRAERPQKGRLREFVQCDIDILGDSSPNAEVELIDVTARALAGHRVHRLHGPRQRPPASCAPCCRKWGSPPGTWIPSASASISWTRSAPAASRPNWRRRAFAPEAVDALDRFLRAGDFSLEAVAAQVGDETLTADLRYVIATSGKIAAGRYGVAYAPSLVRGQGYYTGMVFEVTCPQFSGAVAGGGRYDNMVGKFIGQQVPAVGFSIGFERVCGIPAGAGSSDPRGQTAPGAALPSGSRLCRRAAESGNAARPLRVTVLPQAKKLGKAVRHAGGRRV